MLRRTKAILLVISTILILICQSNRASAQAPIALFDINDSIVCVGNIVSFTDVSTAGGAAITGWAWDFGDLGTSTNQNPTHSYSVGGNYTVTLIITDATNNKDTITHTVYVLLAKALQNTVRICAPQSSTTIVALDPNIAGVTGTWFTSSSAVIASPGNDTTVVSNLISGSYLIFWVVSDGTCSDADQVTIIVDQPVITNAGIDQNICSTSGTATMAATNPSPGTGLWTTTSSATITNPPSRTSTITGLTTPGTYVFVWTTTNGSCVAKDTMQIIVLSPIVSNAGVDQSVCNSNPTTTLAGNNATLGNGLWTTSGSAIITTPTSNTSGVTALANGINTFIWTITNGACITKDTVLVNVSTLIVAAAGNDFQVCTSTGTGTLNGNNPAPGTGLWTAINGGTITSPTSSTTTVTGLTVNGFYKFVWTITNGACVSMDTVTIIVKSPVIANAGIDQNLCNATSTTLIGNSPAPGTALWTTTSTASISSPSSANTNVSNLHTGNYTFIYSTSFGACISRDTIIIHVDTLLIANAGIDQQICESNPTTTLAGNNPTPGTRLWTKINGGTITNPTSATSTVTGIPAGSNLFVWTITNGTCVSRDTVRITVNVQVPANAGLDDEICQGDISGLSANDPSPAIGLWSTPSSAIIANVSNANSTVSGFTNAGIYAFIWTVTNGACVLRDTVRILVDSSIVAHAGADQIFCGSTTATIIGNNPTPGVGLWTSLGTANITSASSASTTVTNLAYGNNLFIWTITNNFCVSSDTINIKRDSLITANAGVDQQICSSTATATLTGNNPSSGSGTWSAISSGTITNPTSATTTISGLNTAGTYNFVWSITNGTCTSRDTVIISVDSNVVANAGPDQQLCETQTSTTLSANAITVGVGIWSTTSTAGITDVLNPFTSVTGLTVGTYQFVWTVTNNNCETYDTITVVVAPLSTVANAGADDAYCASINGITIKGNDPLVGTGLWTSLGTAIVDTATASLTTISNLAIGQNLFIWTISNGACSSSDTVIISSNANPNVDAGPDQFTSSGVPVNLGGSPTASSGTSPYIYTWNPAINLNDSSISNPIATVFVTQQFSVIVTDSLGCSGTDTVMIFINNPPDAINDTIVTNEDSITVIIELGNDTDPDNNINPGAVQIIGGPSNGTAIVNPITGAITYTPTLNYFGADSIHYAVCDSGIPVYCDSAWIYINVLPINDAPIAVDDTISTPEDSCVQIAVLLNDTDIENGIHFGSLAILSGPNNGTATVDTLTGIITYCPNPNFYSNDTLIYIICDNGTPILCDTAMVIITVIPKNDAPIALNDSTSLCSVDSIVYNVLINDIDPEGDSLFVSILSGPFHGTATISPTQQISYIATPFYNGLDSVAYQVCDNGIPSRCDTAYLFITVHSSPQVATAITNNRCFGDSLGTIDITVTGNAPYLINWSNSEVSQDIDSLATGIYILLLSDTFGCAVTMNDTVTGPLIPLTALSNLQPVLCHNDSTGAIDLQLQGGTFPYTFVWNNADTTEDIANLIAGVYSVLIADSNGCTLSVSHAILQPDSSLSASIIVTNIKCAGDSSGFIALTVNGGTPAYSFVWNNSSVLQNQSTLLAGIYSVTITDLNLCSVTIVDSVQSLNAPILSNIVSTSSQCLAGIFANSISNPSGGISPYSFSWSTSDTTNAIDSLNAGVYTLQITDSLGCVNSSTITIVDSSSMNIINSGLATICIGDSIILSVPLYSNVSYSWFLNSTPLVGDTLHQIVVLHAGDYSVQALATCGVFNSGPINISVNTLPFIIVSPGASINCDSLITLTASGGFNYSWSPANLCTTPTSSSTIINPASTTVFTVVVSDTLGCTSVDSVVVNVTCDSLFIPTGFSPNGDGVNDYFVISDVARYPDAVLKIFNRWGDVVYEKDHYDNSWNGFSNSDRIKIGQVLPNGTYYYVFVPGNNESTKAGYVILRR